MNKQFELGHVTLYAKGWYNRTENIFEDLKQILALDGYEYCDTNNIFSIMTNKFKHLEIDLSTFLSEIKPNNCWQVGYYTREHNWVYGYEDYPKYNYETAVIYTILSHLQFLENGSFKFVVPKYNKENKRPSHITLKQVISQFNRKN